MINTQIHPAYLNYQNPESLLQWNWIAGDDTVEILATGAALFD